MATSYVGVSFPFRFDSSGATSTSTLSPDDPSLISESLKQLWFTRKKERIMEPDTGTEVPSHLFENIGDVTDQAILKYELIKAARKYEKRVDILDISFEEVADQESTYIIHVDCRIIKYNQETTLDITANLT